jgi:hypothetical protein
MRRSRRRLSGNWGDEPIARETDPEGTGAASELANAALK